ncbi:MAG: methyl-accepting chemotaxis protein [Treponema phagedenis]|uniref:methyl-accepting chemotaxis protein n=1 Tax=Treponema phagedenis TaxID=162 RepID=UPI003133F873
MGRAEKRKHSITIKLVFYFGIVLLFSIALISAVFLLTSYKALTDNVTERLTLQAYNLSEIVNVNLQSLYRQLETIARNETVRDPNFNVSEKAHSLRYEAVKNTKNFITKLFILDTSGKGFQTDGTAVNHSGKIGVTTVLNGGMFISQPEPSAAGGFVSMYYYIPVYNVSQKIINILVAEINAAMLSRDIKNASIGKTGEAFIVGTDGTIIAGKDEQIVKEKLNVLEKAKQDNAYKDFDRFIQQALQYYGYNYDTYDFAGKKISGAFSKISTTGWTLVICAPTEEFMGGVHKFMISVCVVIIITIVCAGFVILVIAYQIAKPLQKTAMALKNISQGEGDLTISLPVRGNDEISDIALYFNETIKKIRNSIATVTYNIDKMEAIGSELTEHASKTELAAKKIEESIGNVKNDVLSQTTGITEVASVMEQSVRTVEQLNKHIATQAASVEQSSASIEQMVTNIRAVTDILEENTETVESLNESTDIGHTSLMHSVEITKMIIERSDGLLEASTIIQNIASQTNLLAMNAAIEAAHAGNEGKGFAVVAAEIRKLAEEAARQSKSITMVLKELKAMIGELGKSSDTVQSVFSDIYQFAETVKTQEDVIMKTMQMQSAGGMEILRAIKSINTATTEVEHGATEMLTGSKETSTEMQKLASIAAMITENMNTMNTDTIKINSAIIGIAEISRKTHQSIERLAEEVKKFKI